MVIKNGILLRFAAGTYWIINTHQNQLKYDKPIMINESAAFIWKCIENGNSEEEIARKIANRYEIDYNDAVYDVRAFIDDIRARKLIVE